MMHKIIISIILIFSLSSCATIKSSPRPWTTEEKIGAGVLIAGKLADTYTTMWHQNYPDKIYETNPALSKHPSDFKIVTYMGATTALALIVSHYFPKLRLPLCIGYGGLGLYLSWGNYKTTKRVSEE